MLQKETISINAAQGLDESIDSKAAPLGPYELIQDFEFNDEMRIDKRKGTYTLPTDKLDNSINALTIGQDESSFAFVHQDKLCINNLGKVYAWSAANQKWVYKANHKPVKVTSEVVESSALNVVYSDVCSANGITVIGYIETPEASNQTIEAIKSSPDVILKLSLIDESTGTFIKHGLPVQAGGFYRFKIVSFESGKIFLIYYKSGSGFGFQEILRTGELGAFVQLSPAYINTHLEFVKISKNSVIGEACAVSTGDSIFVFNETGKLAFDGSGGTALVYDESLGLNKLWVVTTEQNDDGLKISGNDFNGNNIVKFKSYNLTLVGFTPDLIENSIDLGKIGWAKNQIGFIRSLTAFKDPRATNQIVILFDTDDATIINQQRVNLGKICYLVVNTSGVVVESMKRYANHFNLLSKAVLDEKRKTAYFAAAYAGGEQTANFIFDLFSRQSAVECGHPVAKFDYFSSNGRRLLYLLSEFPKRSDGHYFFSHEYRKKNIFDESSSITALVSSLNSTGLKLHTFDFDVLGVSTVELGGSVHFTAGLPASFDGNSVTENNFLLYPDNLQATAATKALTYDQTLKIISAYSAAQIGYDMGGLGDPIWRGFQIDYGGGETYFFYFAFSEFSIGSLPANSAKYKVKVEVSLSSTAIEVGKALYQAIQAQPHGYGIAPLSYSPTGFALIRFTTGLGSNVPVSVSEITTEAGSIEAGKYFYKAILSYYDKAGNRHRSATTNPVEVDVPANGRVSICGVVGAASLRDISKIKVEIYRTLKNGSIYYKLSEEWDDISLTDHWVQDPFEQAVQNHEAGRFYFFDKKSDVEFKSNESLYTTGSVQENIGLSNLNCLSSFKSRLIAATCDNPSNLYYSKTIQPNAPIEFTPYNFKEISANSDAIVSVAQLDDKLVAFKRSQIVVFGGDGANDLGLQDGFSQPLVIASDVGAISSQNCVLPFGLIFNSIHGIYALTRSLELQHLGKPVKNTNRILSITALKSYPHKRQMRIQVDNANYALVFDFEKMRWMRFSNYSGQSGCEWLARYVRIDRMGKVYVESENSYKDLGSTVQSYNQKLVTKWLKIKGIQDFQRIYRMSILGDFKTRHLLKVKAFTDYDEQNFDFYEFDSDMISGSLKSDSVYQPQIHFKSQKCQALKLEIEIVPNPLPTDLTNTEQAVSITDLAFQVGLKAGLGKVKKEKKL